MPSLTNTPIPIIGGGLAGLTLGRCLQQRGIRTTIYEQADRTTPRHNYNITLREWAFQPLITHLHLDIAQLLNRTAVVNHTVRDRLTQSQSPSLNHDGTKKLNSPLFPLHVHRGQFEDLIRGDRDGEGTCGLDIRWNHALQSISRDEEKDEWELRFSNPSSDTVVSVRTPFVIDTSGIHSPIRAALAPTSRPIVWPYVVYRGTRRVPLDGEFMRMFTGWVDGGGGGSDGDGTTLQHRIGNVLLRIQMVGLYDETSRVVNISYTYSRPAFPDRLNRDPLFNPHRDPSGARIIPSEFFDEIAILPRPLSGPFEGVFDVREVRRDRVLCWLMRSCVVPLEELRRFAGMGVFLVGDAAHAAPVVGSEGGSWAVGDALGLAALVGDEGGRIGVEGFEGWVGRRFEEWVREGREGVRRLEEMHGKEDGEARLEEERGGTQRIFLHENDSGQK